MPKASMALAIVLAVYMPPQAPGQDSYVGRSSPLFFGDGSRQGLPNSSGKLRRYRVEDIGACIRLELCRHRPSGLACSAAPLPHKAAGHVLSHPGMAWMSASYQWAAMVVSDGIGDDLPRLQRVTHAVVAHANAITHADGVETHAHQAGRAHAVFTQAASWLRCMLQVLPSYQYRGG